MSSYKIEIIWGHHQDLRFCEGSAYEVHTMQVLTKPKLYQIEDNNELISVVKVWSNTAPQKAIARCGAFPRGIKAKPCYTK